MFIYPLIVSTGPPDGIVATFVRSEVALDEPALLLFVPDDDLEGLGHECLGIQPLSRCHDTSLAADFPVNVGVLEQAAKAVKREHSAHAILLVEL